MSKNVDVIPFTELVERVGEIARERAEIQPKIRGYVNDVYLREIGRKWDWNFLLVGSTITVNSSYTTGTLTANTGGTQVVFSSDVTLSPIASQAQLKITGNDYIYKTTYESTTSLTIQPPISGNLNYSNAAYTIFFPFYALAQDFDRFPKNGGFLNYVGGVPKSIQETPYQEWVSNYSPQPTDTPERVRIYGVNTAGNQILELNPPPKTTKSYPYNYFIALEPMRQTTAGLIGNIIAQGTSVVGDSNTRFTEANTGDFFRIDAFGKGNDSEWYRIISIVNNSTMTLQTAFGLSGATSASYTICSVPQMPVKLHPAVLYGAVLQAVADQDDPMYSAYNMKLAEVLSDGKRLYVSRVYNQDIHTLAEDYLYRY